LGKDAAARSTNRNPRYSIRPKDTDGRGGTCEKVLKTTNARFTRFAPREPRGFAPAWSVKWKRKEAVARFSLC